MVLIFPTILLTYCEGPTGPAGDDGNANVKTDIIRVYSSEWGYDSGMYGVDLNSSILTQDIIDNGAALLYWEIGNGMWMALPIDGVYYGVMEETVGIIASSYTFTESTQTFKLVAIAGVELAKHPNLDLSSHDQVNAVFEL